ncbi:MAG: hypothetical protein ACYDFU_01830 [Nitrospirota bacterium]
MENRGSFVNVKTKDGKVLLSLFPGKDIVLEGKLDTVFRQGNGSTERKSGNGGNSGNGSRGNGDDSMTFPQKRLLFRLLAQEGIEGDAATEHLNKLFQVNSLNEVTKMEASRVIDGLLKEAKGDGGNGNGIPF